MERTPSLQPWAGDPEMADLPGIRERLAGIEEKLGGFRVDFAEHRQEDRDGFDAITSRLERLLDGDASKPGLVTRVDRLEQTEMRRNRTYWIAVTAAITSVVGLLMNIFLHRP